MYGVLSGSLRRWSRCLCAANSIAFSTSPNPSRCLAAIGPPCPALSATTPAAPAAPALPLHAEQLERPNPRRPIFGQRIDILGKVQLEIDERRQLSPASARVGLKLHHCIVHAAEHGTTGGRPDRHLSHRLDLTRDALRRHADRTQQFLDLRSQPLLQSLQWRRRHHHRQQAPLAHRQHQLRRPRVQQVRIPVAEHGARRDRLARRRGADTAQQFPGAAQREHAPKNTSAATAKASWPRAAATPSAPPTAA